MAKSEKEKLPITRDTIVASLDFSKVADVHEGQTIGLVPAIVQDNTSGRVLMLAFMNAAALEKTIRSGRATFWTRSRKRLWTKGEESGNFMNVVRIEVDCDADTVLLLVEPQGDAKACHTGEESCFYRGFDLKP
ncbi:MAG: phosphoribosyl-AMP cyclohydrolase [Rhodospirillales bacterium]|nr:phosphoribosyl-AMP cyclohydrolase [Alphaproteobacteria bacterium]MCB9986195.1 phosphoribosyl-AMP cyclohydrolase [Rhodospirillales bacterium]USO07248.1 MAG: phosphoribosyl-AMP cyclohydrolase [Rhodospirillales bacterium]